MMHPLPLYIAREWKRILSYALLAIVVAIIGSVLVYSHLFGPTDNSAVSEQFIVQPDTDLQTLSATLKSQHLVRSTWALRIALFEESNGREIVRPGGYAIGKQMDAWTVAKILTGVPAMVFVTFPPGLRKEQMGDILADALNWTDAEKKEWNTTATSPDPDFVEGVYYPDTYLIPNDQSPAQVAARMRGRFTDEFAPYAKEAQEKGLVWTDVLTLASIVDKEAGKNDKPVVAGILWNRLNTGMRLQADATLQYAKGKEGNWWPQPMSADKYIQSAFNTYMHSGLPPHPINNPSLASIEAVINPANTDCIYYLHDASHDIHCSLTYAGQVKNVNTYLR